MRTIVVLTLLLIPGVLTGGVLVSFAPLKEGEDRVTAAAFALDDKRLATIAVVGADPEQASIGAEKGAPELQLLLHDPVSRLTILGRPADLVLPAAAERGPSIGLRPGDKVYLDQATKGEASRVVKWENEHREKVLPLALMRVHHPGDKAPEPGTPLYDSDGQLVAICHEAAPEFGNGTYALPVEVVARAEVDHQSLGKLERCWIGITMENRNALPVVNSVRPESPAASGGLRKGDLLLTVGMYDVSSYADAVNAFFYLVSGNSTPVTILRGVQRLELQVIPEVHPLANSREGTESEK